jgi:hypothetical protein
MRNKLKTTAGTCRGPLPSPAVDSFCDSLSVGVTSFRSAGDAAGLRAASVFQSARPNWRATSSRQSVSGTTGWTERSVVLDVPPEAMSLHYGFFLKGFGRVRARRFRLEMAAENARTTEIPRQVGISHHLPRPDNLDFSKSSPMEGRP